MIIKDVFYIIIKNTKNTIVFTLIFMNFCNILI